LAVLLYSCICALFVLQWSSLRCHF
jgi:hypothetical protein